VRSWTIKLAERRVKHAGTPGGVEISSPFARPGLCLTRSLVWRHQMSDEINKPEVVNTTEEKQIDEKALDEVVGGKLYEATIKGTHIPEVKIES
jgi:hypothetical protein